MSEQAIDNLSPEEIGRLFPIVLSEPDEGWKALFEQEKYVLRKILGQNAVKIEHFGSTAIPGIRAKPTIDILVEIPNDKKVKDAIIQIMQSHKYYFTLREDRKPPYLMFIKGISAKGVTGQIYHIHMAEKEHRDLWDRLYFRDYLIENPKLAREYENLKIELAAKYKHDRDAYTNAKSDLVLSLTKEAKEKYA